MESKLKVGCSIEDFTLVKIDKLKEYDSLGYEFIHRTGLKLYHISNKDRENTFSFNFRTPAEDNCGTPHIVEHSVLSGSRDYPLKDPFQGMMKGSVNTFLNAYTFPDKTSYPASSVVEKDFYNLMAVYGDAVFFPLLRKETFLQEGWRLDFDRDNPYFTGIVYNEMLGVYSSHEQRVYDASVSTLYTHGPYSYDSGGKPEDITDLTYEGFVNYHRKWYNPSNCFVYLYGDLPTEKSLKFINSKFLKGFPDCSSIELNYTREEWVSPRNFKLESPTSKIKERGADLLLNWKLPPQGDPLLGLSFEILDRLLLGSDSSCLKNALEESDLWDDLSPASGLDNEHRFFSFSIGVRGAHKDDLPGSGVLLWTPSLIL